MTTPTQVWNIVNVNRLIRPMPPEERHMLTVVESIVAETHQQPYEAHAWSQSPQPSLVPMAIDGIHVYRLPQEVIQKITRYIEQCFPDWNIHIDPQDQHLMISTRP